MILRANVAVLNADPPEEDRIVHDGVSVDKDEEEEEEENIAGDVVDNGEEEEEGGGADGGFQVSTCSF